MDPDVRMHQGDIKFNDMPSFQYAQNAQQEIEKGRLTKEDLHEIFDHMTIIRTFEEFFWELIKTSQYEGIEYTYRGPAHLSIGEEAACVGQSFLTTKDDFVFGAHRNHGEVIAKAFAAIYHMEDQQLKEIMETYLDGEIYNVTKDLKKYSNVKEEARYFFMYGFLAEIFARKTGINRGLGGSMHLFFTPFGIFPNNAVVGGSAPLAAGAALYKLVNKQPGVVIANLGDGAVATGPVWESLNFMAMDQYKELWPEGYNKRPPMMMNIMNNGYSMGGQTVGETMGYKDISRIGAGVNPEGMYGERVDGQNPLAVIDLMRRQMELAKNGDGPTMADIVTYRFAGHSTGDAEEPYRTKDETNEWREKEDPIMLYKAEMKNLGLMNEEYFELSEKIMKEMVFTVFKAASNPELTPKLEFETDDQILDKYMISHERYVSPKPKEIETSISREENPRVQRIAKKARYAFKDGKEVSKMRQFQIRDSIFEAILDGYYDEPTFIKYGQEQRDWGGPYAVSQGLTEAVPYQRFFNSPIAEAAMIGGAVGYAMCGGKIMVELMYFDFLFRCGDELANQMAKWRSMSGGVMTIPVIVRTNIGAMYGAQHSQDYTSVMAHIPGINIVQPVTPYDAKGLMATAMKSADPVFYIENQKLYDKGEYFHEAGVPTESYEIPFGEPIKRTNGKDLTIFSIGASLYVAMDAAKRLKDEFGIEAEVIDGRSISPLDYTMILDSVKKTGKIVLMNNGAERGNFMKNIASNISEMAFDYLDAPPVVLGARNWIMPGVEFESYIYPQVEDVLSVVHEKIMRLKDYTPEKNHTNMEMLRRNKFGY
jgi:2-oxoisovalerate dehydrogenase E1 component